MNAQVDENNELIRTNLTVSDLRAEVTFEPFLEGPQIRTKFSQLCSIKLKEQFLVLCEELTQLLTDSAVESVHVFLSYAREEHVPNYYSEFCYFLKSFLSDLGFKVLFDEDHVAGHGIGPFMDRISDSKVDFVISLISPLYQNKLESDNDSGVKYEMRKIYERVKNNPNPEQKFDFFIPLLLHKDNRSAKLNLESVGLEDALYIDFKQRVKFYDKLRDLLIELFRRKSIVSLEFAQVKKFLTEKFSAFQNVFTEMAILEAFDRQRNFIRERISSLPPNESDEAVLLLGPTGAGKSTVAAFLANQTLTAIRKNRKLLLVNDSFSIGDILGSKAPIPYQIEFKDHRSALWDVPGFFDNGGYLADLVKFSSFFIALTNQPKVRIVLVIDYSNLEHRGVDVFGSTIKKLTSMFSLKDLKAMTTLLVTKCPEENFWETVKQDCIEPYLDNQDIQDNLSSETNELIQFLVSQNAGFTLPIPRQEGIYNISNSPLDLLSQIRKSKSVINPDFKPKLENEELTTLKMLIGGLNDHLAVALGDLKNGFGSLIEKRIASFTDDPDKFSTYFNETIYQPFRSFFLDPIQQLSDRDIVQRFDAMTLPLENSFRSQVDALKKIIKQILLLRVSVCNNDPGDTKDSSDLQVINLHQEKLRASVQPLLDYLKLIQLTIDEFPKFIPVFPSSVAKEGQLEKLYLHNFPSFLDPSESIQKRLSVFLPVSRNYIHSDESLTSTVQYFAKDNDSKVHEATFPYIAKTSWKFEEYSYEHDDRFVTFNLEIEFHGVDESFRVAKTFPRTIVEVIRRKEEDFFDHEDFNLQSKAYCRLYYDLPAEINELKEKFNLQPPQDYFLSIKSYTFISAERISDSKTKAIYKRADNSLFEPTFDVPHADFVKTPSSENVQRLVSNQLIVASAINPLNPTNGKLIVVAKKVDFKTKDSVLEVNNLSKREILSTVQENYHHQQNKKYGMKVTDTFRIEEKVNQSITSIEKSAENRYGGYTTITTYEKDIEQSKNLTERTSQPTKKGKNHHSSRSEHFDDGSQKTILDKKVIDGKLTQEVGFHGHSHREQSGDKLSVGRLTHNARLEEDGKVISTGHLVEIQTGKIGESPELRTQSVKLLNGIIQEIHGVKSSYQFSTDHKPGDFRRVVIETSQEFSQSLKDPIAAPITTIDQPPGELVKNTMANVASLEANNQLTTTITSPESTTTTVFGSKSSYAGLVKTDYKEVDGKQVDQTLSRASDLAMRGYSAACGTVVNSLIPKVLNGEKLGMSDLVSTVGNTVEGLAQGQLAEVFSYQIGKAASPETDVMLGFGLAYLGAIVYRHRAKHFKHGQVVKVHYGTIDSVDPTKRTDPFYEVQELQTKKVYKLESSNVTYCSDVFIGRSIVYKLVQDPNTTKKGKIRKIFRKSCELDTNVTVTNDEIIIPKRESEEILQLDDYVTFYNYDDIGKTCVDAALEIVGSIVQIGISVSSTGIAQTSLVSLAQFAVSTCLLISDWGFGRLSGDQFQSNLIMMTKDLALTTISGNAALYCLYTPIVSLLAISNPFATVLTGVALFSLGNWVGRKIVDHFERRPLKNEYLELCKKLALSEHSSVGNIATRTRQRLAKRAPDKINTIHPGKIIKVHDKDPKNVRYDIDFKGLDLWYEIPHAQLRGCDKYKDGPAPACYQVDDIVRVEFLRSNELFQEVTKDFDRYADLHEKLGYAKLHEGGEVTPFFGFFRWIKETSSILQFSTAASTSEPATTTTAAEGKSEEASGEIHEDWEIIDPEITSQRNHVIDSIQSRIISNLENDQILLTLERNEIPRVWITATNSQLNEID